MITLVRLIGFAKNYWIWLLTAFLCLLGTTAFALSMPWFLQIAIDNAIGGGNPTPIMKADILSQVKSVCPAVLAQLPLFGDVRFRFQIIIKTYQAAVYLYDIAVRVTVPRYGRVKCVRVNAVQSKDTPAQSGRGG